jgi:uncharacterized cupin superfamily protein
MVPEAKIVRTQNGLVPNGEGWYVLNARDASWLHTDELGVACTFEGEVRFGEFGINVSVLAPGQPACMYHGEQAQEDFLVLEGECLVLIEGEERPLRKWDFVHCPPWTEHVLVGAGSGPCVILSAGARGGKRGLVYPASDLARRYGAGVEKETSSEQEAYAAYERPRDGPYQDGFLPD